jgi:hypothetical protein
MLEYILVSHNFNELFRDDFYAAFYMLGGMVPQIIAYQLFPLFDLSELLLHVAIIVYLLDHLLS